MDSTGEYQNRRTGAVLLAILFGLGLAWLALPGPAQAGVQEEWVRTFNSSKGSSNYPNDIHVDKKGNVYVTGYPALIKYSPGGRELWNLRVPSVASCLDNHGNIYVTGSVTINGHTACGISKYDSDGTLLWESHYQESEKYWDIPLAIALDRRDNVYVTLVSGVIKYSPDGILLWAAPYRGPPGKGIDHPSAMAVDRRGNVYVTGASYEIDQNKVDYATIKYNTNGQKLWMRRYAGPGNWQDIPTALAVDGRGNVYVTGFSSGELVTHYYDYATIKYTPNGRKLWVRRYNGKKGGHDEARAIAVDSRGNVYVTGQSDGPGPSFRDYATIKYSPDGQKLWVRRFHSPGYGNDGPTAMVLDNRDNIYVTGRSNMDYATIKYSPDGRQLWVKRLNGPEEGSDGATAIAVDDYGHVYVTGFIDRQWPDSIMNYCTIKYRQRGRSITDPY